MKKRPLALLVIVLFVMLIWLRWPGFWSAQTSEGKHSVTTPSATKGLGTVASAAGTSAAKPAPQLITPVRQDKLELLRDLAQKSNKPIHFYGLVLDQENTPIPGVMVTLSIRTAKEPVPGQLGDVFDYPLVTTDAQGRFAITDAKGALLSVKSLVKPGYEASTKKINQAYWYWNDPRAVFHPDTEKPEVFRMWKKAGAERLVNKGIGRRISYDGTPTNFDLLDGKTVADGGDLRVTLTRNPQQIQWGQTHYEWTATIEAVNGGIIESTDEQMYRAPNEGYTPKFAVHMAADDPQWTDRKDVTAYLRMRGGKYYGRIKLEFMVGSDRHTTPFYVVAFVNPKGSQNLEYDSSQDWQADARSEPTRQP